jgi:hypothetical protein
MAFLPARSPEVDRLECTSLSAGHRRLFHLVLGRTLSQGVLVPFASALESDAQENSPYLRELPEWQVLQFVLCTA